MIESPNRHTRPDSLLPRVDAVGVVHYPRDWRPSPRRRSSPLRGAIVLLAALFASVALATGAVSLGAYCLTTHGGDRRELATPPTATTSHAAPRLTPTAEARRIASRHSIDRGDTAMHPTPALVDPPPVLPIDAGQPSQLETATFALG